jgi:L-lactate dehydrogenase (cytochrome)
VRHGGNGRGGLEVRPAEIAALLRTGMLERSRERRRLGRCHTIADLRLAARRRLPRGVFDYIDWGAEDEVSLRRNSAAFGGFELTPWLSARRRRG